MTITALRITWTFVALPILSLGLAFAAALGGMPT